MNWLLKIIQAVDNTNSRGLDDGGLGIGGKLFPGQATSFWGGVQARPRRRNVNKKNKPTRTERPGEQKDY